MKELVPKIYLDKLSGLSIMETRWLNMSKMVELLSSLEFLKIDNLDVCGELARWRKLTFDEVIVEMEDAVSTGCIWKFTKAFPVFCCTDRLPVSGDDDENGHGAAVSLGMAYTANLTYKPVT